MKGALTAGGDALAEPVDGRSGADPGCQLQVLILIKHAQTGGIPQGRLLGRCSRLRAHDLEAEMLRVVVKLVLVRLRLGIGVCAAARDSRLSSAGTVGWRSGYAVHLCLHAMLLCAEIEEPLLARYTLRVWCALPGLIRAARPACASGIRPCICWQNPTESSCNSIY